MPLSNSVLRRYTPPTCTLEIVAKSSPLSRWVGQSALKDLRFELRFDDPRKPEDQRVTIRGERTELEILCEVVNSYVQDFLSQSSSQLSIALQMLSTPPDTSHKVDKVSHAVSDDNYSEPITAQTSDEELHKPDSTRRTFEPETVATDIYIQPRGFLGHDLFLGRLATEDSGPAVNLSVLQLFDLATALDEYATDVVALPNLSSSTSWHKNLPTWTPTAAAVVLAVGVTATAVKFLDQPKTQQAAAPKAGQTPVPAQTPLLSQVPPAPGSPLPIAPLPTPALPPSIAASPKLTPPPPVTVPPPGSFAPPTRERPTITISPTPPTSADTPQQPTTAIVPGGIASLPNPSGSTSTSNSPSPSVSAKRSASSSSPRDTSASSSESTSTQQNQTNTPVLPPSPPPLPALPPISVNSSPSEVAQQTAPSADARTSAASEQQNPTQSAAADNAAASNRQSDTIPQVTEAKTYFEQRWKPPADLTQTIEYSLVLNPNGSIQRILPLGKAAGDNIDRTGIPLIDEPFVSPLQVKGNPSIRVVFSPDGKVQTFLEK